MFVMAAVTLDFVEFASTDSWMKSNVAIFNTTRVIAPVLAIWLLMYFVQLLPSIGHFIITIQAILVESAPFSVVFILFLIPFKHTFQIIINTNSKIGCINKL